MLTDRHASAAVDADRELVRRAQRGDASAFEQLVQRRLGQAFRTACALVGNETDARDVAQDAFLSAWRNLPRLRDPRAFDAWLNRILVNQCRDLLRSRSRAREVLLDVVEDKVASEGPSIEAIAIRRAFDRLSVDQRHLLVLHHVHHYPVAGIASQLGIPIGTAKWRLHQARRALERAMEAET